MLTEKNKKEIKESLIVGKLPENSQEVLVKKRLSRISGKK